ncbi:unnamed protein product [Durusdinium trenchii]|uniref:Uncharacterized protein n=1 Tax=Durusdinium trenchii TaxID=1381693 RepID=A0ABP0L9D6_9DINO
MQRKAFAVPSKECLPQSLVTGAQAKKCLKHFCEFCIKDSFNETHVLQLFEASSRLDVEGTQAVRAMALDFIISNFHTVCQQPALEQLDRSLLVEIMRGVADRLHPPPHVQTVQLG